MLQSAEKLKLFCISALLLTIKDLYLFCSYYELSIILQRKGKFFWHHWLIEFGNFKEPTMQREKLSFARADKAATEIKATPTCRITFAN